MGDRFWVYILANRIRGTLYVGVTNDLGRRIFEHKSGAIPGFTNRYGVKLLVHVEPFSSIIDARQREHTLKRWRRAWKLELVESANPDWRDLSDDLLK